jgi:autotransporter family porin
MQFRIKLIIAGVFAGTSPLLPYAKAAELGQIIVSDPAGNTSVSLNPGDSVAFTGDGRVDQSAIYVAGTGNTLHAEGNVISANNWSDKMNPAAVKAVDGGTITLSKSSVTTQGGTQGHALWASGSGSTITAINTDLKNIDGVGSYSVLAESGGKVVLEGGTIETSYGQNIAVRAVGKQSLAVIKDVSITGESGVYASISTNAGARIELENVQLKVKNGYAGVIADEGTVLSMTNSNLTVQGGEGGVVVTPSGTLHMNGGTVQAASPIKTHSFSKTTIQDAILISDRGAGFYMEGNPYTPIHDIKQESSADLNNVSIQSVDAGVWVQNAGARLNGDQLSIRSGHVGIGNITGAAVVINSAVTTLNKDAHALYVSREIAGTKASTRAVNTTIKTEGDAAFGALVRFSDANITLEDSTIDTVGNGSHGLFASGKDASLNTYNTLVRTTGDNAAGLSASDGAITKLSATRISTRGGNAAGLSTSDNAITNLDDTQISTTGNNAAGLSTSDNAITNLDDTQISTTGDNAAGLSASNHAVTTLNATQISTVGDNAAGLSTSNNAVTKLDATQIGTRGNSAAGLSTSNNAMTTLNATQISTAGDNAAGLSASDNAITKLNDTQISTRGKNADGIRSSATISGASNEITLSSGSHIDTRDGAGMVFEGGKHKITLADTIITTRTAGKSEDGVLLYTANSASPGAPETEQVQLNARNSLLFGDVIARSGAVNLNLEQGSSFTGAIQQADKGHVDHLTLDNSSVWNVRDSSTLGTLTNRGIVRFAPTADSEYQTLTVRNYIGGGMIVLRTQLGDDDAPTDRLVIDGGNASGSTALRIINTNGTGAYTTQGLRVVETTNGAATNSNAFYLDAGSPGYRARTKTIAVNGYDYRLVRGGIGGQTNDWYLSSRIPSSSLDNVSPESGAYAGNQRAAMNLFALSLYDRSAGLDTKGRLWTRISGRRDHGLRMADGAVDIRTDSTMLQMGADLIRFPMSTGALYIGAMGGYGDVRTRSTSTLQLPTQSESINANGKVSGYALGVYLTTYADDATRLGTYTDTWLQYGRYKNVVSSDLGASKYNSDVWSASLEAGHALKPYGADSSLRDIVVTPRMQLSYGRYQAKDATLNDTLMQSGSNNVAHSRLGLRIQQHDNVSQATSLPYAEANWVRRLTGKPSVRMGDNLLDLASARNAWELKLGFDSHLNQRLRLSAQALTLFSGQERGYSAMLKLDYRW